MSVKSKKKPAVKKTTVQNKTTSKPALKKPATKKVAASKSAKASNANKVNKANKVGKGVKVTKNAKTTKVSRTSATNKALPGSSLSKAYQSAHAETKKLMVPANKKASTAKQAWMNSAKKLKNEQDNLSKLEQKHSAKPSAALTKQVTSARNKVKLATSVHSKAQSAHDEAVSRVSHYQNHLNKLAHLEKTHRDSSAAWDKQNAVKTAAKPASKQASKPVSGSNAKVGSAKPKAKTGSNPAKTGLTDERTWTKFDEGKDGLFSKVDSLAQYDSELDDADNWNKSGHN